MNTMPKGVAEFIGTTENEAIARFYDRVGLGNLYRRANNTRSLKQVIGRFTKRGYEIVRVHEIIRMSAEGGSDTTVRYQMILLHEGVEIASQNIRVEAKITDMVVYDEKKVENK